MTLHQFVVPQGGCGIQVSLGQFIRLDPIATGHRLVVDEIGADGKEQQHAVRVFDIQTVFSGHSQRPAVRDHPHADLIQHSRAALRVLPVDPSAAVVGGACAIENQIAAIDGHLALHLRFQHGLHGAAARLAGRQADSHDLLRMRDKRLPHEGNIVLRVADRRNGAFQIQFAIIRVSFSGSRKTQPQRACEHVGLAVIGQ